MDNQSEQPVVQTNTTQVDGIGLTFEQVRSLLIKEHKTTMSDDDPMLMIVTIFNAFLTEYDKLLKRHNSALTSYFESQAKSLIDSARKASEAASGAHIIDEACQKHLNALNIFQSNLKWLAAIIATAALVNIAAFVIKALA